MGQAGNANQGYNTLLALPGMTSMVSPSDESEKEASIMPRPLAQKAYIQGERSNVVSDRDVNSHAQKSCMINYEKIRTGSRTQGLLLVDTCHHQACQLQNSP